MNHHPKAPSRVLALLLGLSGLTCADPLSPPQAQISITAGSSGTWNLDWQGVSHRVYFMQWSVDLVNWSFCPFMNFGSELHSRGFNSSTPKLFMRLFYYDDTNIDTLEQAMNHDYDGDGVSNMDEITVLGTSPNQFSSNGTGISDGAQDFDQDGISNADEVALGLDPGVDHTDPASGAVAVQYSYDDTDRLTGVTSPVAVKSYQLDPEVNIQGQ